MDTKQYLSQISRYDKLIKNKLSEISQFRDLACSVSSVTNTERVNCTPDFDKLGAIYCKIEKMETQLDKFIDFYVDKKNLIISQIESMENETYFEVLFAKYIEKKTFEDIASEMKYSWRDRKSVV